MIAAIDYYGIAAVIAAITGLVTSVGAVLIHRTTSDTQTKLKTGNGKTPGEILTDSDATATAVAEAVGADIPPKSETSVPSGGTAA